MRKGDIIEGKIEYLKFPNKGTFTYVPEVNTENPGQQEATRIVEVKNALPGQTVKARVGKRRNGRVDAQLLEVTEPASFECKPNCPKYGQCGGCLYLSYPYEEELKIKDGQVHKLLEDALGESVDSWMEPIVPSPIHEGYRNKMEFTFGDEEKDGPMTLGMHKRGSFYDVVDANECEIVDEDYNKILTVTRDFFAGENPLGQRIPFYHRMRMEGYERHLHVRKASQTGEILKDLVTTTQTEGFGGEGTETVLQNAWAYRLRQETYKGEIIGILHTKNDSVADIVEDQGTETLYGQPYFNEELLGLKFVVTPFSFFQTNSYGAEVLYDIARQYIGSVVNRENTGAADSDPAKKPVVFDLYCGTGTISQLVSPAASKVIGVEIVEEAVEAAKENAIRNGVDNCEFIAGDVLKVIDEIEEKPDLIILDPPRDGVHPKALPKILAYGVDYILYISCKPTSLARDLPTFIEAGYKPVKGTVVDQFPRTANMETIVLLSNKNV